MGKKRKVKSADWRPSGFAKVEWSIIQRAKNIEQSRGQGNPLTMSELKQMQRARPHRRQVAAPEPTA
jgi:hypothetical protein